jgi:hypothetical protein
MIGITLITALALLCGFLVHSLTQLITARRNAVDITVQQYFIGHWPETLLAAICAIVLYLGMPELATLFPDFAKSIGATGQQTVLSSFAAGFFGNWLSNFLGARARSIAGVSQ